MTICPHCQKLMELEQAPQHNVLAYGSPVLARTLCCGYGVMLHRVQSIRITAYTGTQEDDDWGHALRTPVKI